MEKSDSIQRSISLLTKIDTSMSSGLSFVITKLMLSGAK